MLPSPRAVATSLGQIGSSGELWTHAGATLGRIAVSFSLAVIVSLLMGLLASASRLARVAVSDLIVVFNSTSVFVWIVVSLIWFGLSNMAPMFTTFMVTLAVMGSNVLEGIGNVDSKYLEMAKLYRLTAWDEYRHIVIPTTMPYLIAGMKVAFGLALKVSVVAEIFGVTSGIGYIMNYSRETLATDRVFAWAIVMCVIMFLMDRLVFDAISRKVQRWR